MDWFGYGPKWPVTLFYGTVILICWMHVECTNRSPDAIIQFPVLEKSEIAKICHRMADTDESKLVEFHEMGLDDRILKVVNILKWISCKFWQ